jgi:hypothetical protein
LPLRGGKEATKKETTKRYGGIKKNKEELLRATKEVNGK